MNFLNISLAVAGASTIGFMFYNKKTNIFRLKNATIAIEDYNKNFRGIKYAFGSYKKGLNENVVVVDCYSAPDDDHGHCYTDYSCCYAIEHIPTDATINVKDGIVKIDKVYVGDYATHWSTYI